MKKLSKYLSHSSCLRRISSFQVASLLAPALSQWLGLIILLCLALTGQAQVPTITWQKSLGGTSTDIARAITASPDGGYVVVGSTESNNGDVSGNHDNFTSDFWVVKLDGSGNKVWQKALGGTGNDVAYAITASADGGYVVAGSTESNDGDVTNHHGNQDFWVVKLDGSGNKVWQKALGGSGADVAYAITASADGGYVVAGSTKSNNGDVSGNHTIVPGPPTSDFWVVKLNSTGDLVWQKTLGGTSEEVAQAITASPDGGYVVAGYTSSNNGDVTNYHGGQDFWVVKLDGSGNKVWQKALGGSSVEYAYGITASPDGSYVVAGYSVSNNGDVTNQHGNGDFWVVKLDGSGDLVWQKTFGGTINESAYAITVSTDGGYVVAGSTSSYDGDVTGFQGLGDYWVAKLDESGNLVWQKTLGGLGSERAYALTASGDGGYVIAGFADRNNGDVSGNHGGNDYWVVKLNTPNTPPTVASLTASPSPACAGQSVTFTATIANTSGTYSYTLTNNAGTTKTGSASGNTFSQSVTAAGSGSQNFTLTVTDPQSGSGAGSVDLTVNGSESSLSAQSGDWNTASTWACGTVPTDNSAVQIQAGHVVTIGAVVQAHSLSLKGGLVSFLNGGKLGLEN